MTTHELAFYVVPGALVIAMYATAALIERRAWRRRRGAYRLIVALRPLAGRDSY